MGFLNNMFGGGGMFQGGPASTPSWNGDFSGNLNDILAPYKQMAAQYTSPYATMSPNSWLVRNHPQLAGVLDNAFLTAGMTPGPQGPEGVGGGIARAMQGLMGAQGYRREQMLRGAMLPYQMGMQQVQMQDTLSQIKEREAMAPYYRARSDWYEGRLEEANRPRFVPGSYKVDDKGNNWQEIFDPVAGTTRLFNPTSQKHADELPTDQQPSFNNEKKIARQSGMTEIERMVNDQDRANIATGKPPMTASQRNEAIVSFSNRMAGGKVGAGDAAALPYQEARSFEADQEKTKYEGLPTAKELSQDDWAAKSGPFVLNHKYGMPLTKQQQDRETDLYNKYSQNFQQSVGNAQAQRDAQYGQYLAWRQHQKVEDRTTFSQYRQQQAAPASAPAPTSSASNPNSKPPGW